MKGINLKTMSFDDLVELRDNAERIIMQRAASERRMLEDKLAKLSGFGGNKRARGNSRKGRKVPPKYRNPDNAAETWAGRGATPRWLQALLKQGRKVDEFSIQQGAAAKSTAKSAAKKSRRKKAG